MRQLISPEKRSRIVAALKANSNSLAVARQFGVSQTAVWKIAKKARIDLKVGRAKARAAIAPEKRAEVVAALRANPNANSVAREVGGVSYQTVWVVARDEKIKLTAGRAVQGRKLSPAKRAEIIAAIETSPNLTQAAKRAGVSWTTVDRIAGQLVASESRRTRRRMPP